MKAFLTAYDFIKPWKDYSDLIATIKDHQRFLMSSPEVFLADESRHDRHLSAPIRTDGNATRSRGNEGIHARRRSAVVINAGRPRDGRGSP